MLRRLQGARDYSSQAAAKLDTHGRRTVNKRHSSASVNRKRFEDRVTKENQRMQERLAALGARRSARRTATASVGAQLEASAQRRSIGSEHHRARYIEQERLADEADSLRLYASGLRSDITHIKATSARAASLAKRHQRTLHDLTKLERAASRPQEAHRAAPRRKGKRNAAAPAWVQESGELRGLRSKLGNLQCAYDDLAARRRDTTSNAQRARCRAKNARTELDQINEELRRYKARAKWQSALSAQSARGTSTNGVAEVALAAMHDEESRTLANVAAETHDAKVELAVIRASLKSKRRGQHQRLEHTRRGVEQLELKLEKKRGRRRTCDQECEKWTQRIEDGASVADIRGQIEQLRLDVMLWRSRVRRNE